ncbi:hypothetical protein [Streptomyces vinaceus]|uniref:hypothetical protein n=1 Tax=Streptomyces vinaceus TaxID=1960 RepID=UPI0036C5F2D3
MESTTREYEGPATVGGLRLPKVRIREGVEEPNPEWQFTDPGYGPHLRWWDGEAQGDDPRVLAAVRGLLDGPVDVVLPTGQGRAFLNIDWSLGVDSWDPDWTITLRGTGPSPLR